jgi:ribosomal protein L11 methyltransferase
LKTRRAPSRHAVWCWQRWIKPEQEEAWTERLDAATNRAWTLTERPDRKLRLLAVYHPARPFVLELQRQLGGTIRQVADAEWIGAPAAAPLVIGKGLTIVNAQRSGRGKRDALYIPHGLAFGSGEHATTLMLLRALVARGDLSRQRILDLGTGSGILALAARRLGARKIVAIDFDADAVRTARENEARNFADPLIRWRRGDVKRLRPARNDLVLANLFSGILCEAAARIGACVADRGELWLSGILRTQADDVKAAYRREKLRLIGERRRGKWVMLQLSRT